MIGFDVFLSLEVFELEKAVLFGFVQADQKVLGSFSRRKFRRERTSSSATKKADLQVS